MKKKKSKKRTESLRQSSTSKEVLDEIIRVDHAGEYGATRIYDGQIAIFGKYKNWKNNSTYGRSRTRAYRNF